MDRFWNASTNSFLTNDTRLESCRPTYTALDSTSSKICLTMAYCILLLLALVGNCLIVGLYYINPGGRMRSPINYFICNMAVSDILIAVLVIPRRIKEAYLGWSPWLIDGTFGEILCRLVNFSDEVSMAVSIQSMVFIAFERFWSVVLPMTQPVITARHSPRFIVFTWIFAISIFFWYLFTHKLVYNKDEPRCNHEWQEMFGTWEELWKTDRLIFFVLFVAIPFVLLVFFYSAIIVCLYRQEKRFGQLTFEAQRVRARENKTITVMLLSVVILFFIGWTPYYLFTFKHFFSPNTSKWSCVLMKKLIIAAIYLNYVNAGLSPLIYYTFNDTYRKGFRELVKHLCICKCKANIKPCVQNVSD